MSPHKPRRGAASNYVLFRHKPGENSTRVINPRIEAKRVTALIRVYPRQRIHTSLKFGNGDQHLAAVPFGQQFASATHVIDFGDRQGEYPRRFLSCDKELVPGEL